MPINRRSVTIMSGTGDAMNQFSEVVKGDSYYGYTDGLHTIQITYNQFVGRVRIQCTLSMDPDTDRDWFDIVPDNSTGTAFNPLGFVQFNANNPADFSEAYTFQGNFTFIRVYMDREHVGDGSTYDASYGQISRVILSS
jgi:hypothetical protein